MGWNTVRAPDDSALFAGVADQRFYFVHSFAARRLEYPESSIRPPLVTTCDYGGGFVAAVENGPLCATQFHPEKSGAAGLELLRNWLGTL
jgi:glutamine amidotransferase